MTGLSNVLQAIEEQADDGEPFDDKMKRLTGELAGLFEKSHELEKEIREKLGAIGYEVIKNDSEND